jgi:DNA-binding transcriptional MerR regulator
VNDMRYTIRQVADKTGLTVDTVRYYERSGLVPPVRRGGNGYRRFSQDDVGWLVFVSRLRASGMPIVDVRRFVELTLAGDATVPERLALLVAHEQAVLRRLSEARGHLRLLRDKIHTYRAALRD